MNTKKLRVINTKKNKTIGFIHIIILNASKRMSFKTLIQIFILILIMLIIAGAIINILIQLNH